MATSDEKIHIVRNILMRDWQVQELATSLGMSTSKAHEIPHEHLSYEGVCYMDASPVGPEQNVDGMKICQ